MKKKYKLLSYYHPLYGTWYEVHERKLFRWVCEAWFDDEEDAGAYLRYRQSEIKPCIVNITGRWEL